MSKKDRLEAGAPSDGGISLCEPEIRGNEWKYIKDCLDTNWVSSVGKYVDQFENAMALRAQTSYAVAAVNGTAALHISLLVAGVSADDEVLTSTLTFIASANAIRYTGAKPVFIDAEPKYWQMDTAKLKDFLEKECIYLDGALVNKVTRKRVKAIMPVHILGHPVDMDQLIELAEKYNLIVIEDASESLGTKYKGNPTGSLGHIAGFSFNGNKLITTGGGGMITTNNLEWAEKAKYLTTQAKDDPLEFVHGETGYNYRLTNMAAAMGVAQIEMLDEFIETKRRIARRYNQAFCESPGIQVMQEAEWAFSTYWLYTILINPDKFAVSSRDIISKLAQENIQARPLWQPMHRSPAMRDCQSYRCEIADKLNSQAVSLPCSVGLTEIQQNKVINLVLSLSN